MRAALLVCFLVSRGEPGKRPRSAPAKGRLEGIRCSSLAPSAYRGRVAGFETPGRAWQDCGQAWCVTCRSVVARPTVRFSGPVWVVFLRVADRAGVAPSDRTARGRARSRLHGRRLACLGIGAGPLRSGRERPASRRRPLPGLRRGRRGPRAGSRAFASPSARVAARFSLTSLVSGPGVVLRAPVVALLAARDIPVQTRFVAPRTTTTGMRLVLSLRRGGLSARCRSKRGRWRSVRFFAWLAAPSELSDHPSLPIGSPIVLIGEVCLESPVPPSCRLAAAKDGKSRF